METRSEMKLFRFLGVCLLFLCLLGVSVQASLSELYIFGQITGDTTGMCPDAFMMEVTEVPGENQALFKFINNCDNGGVLGRIFVMDNDDLITFNDIYEQAEGVSFSAPVKSPAMLPGGNSLGFTPHNTYSINADPARPRNGLYYEDYVTVLFDLEVPFSDVIGALDGGTLGVGIHAQSLPGGASAAFTTVPEPATLTLVGLGVLLIKRKKRGTAQ